MQIDQVLAYAQ